MASSISPVPRRILILSAIISLSLCGFSVAATPESAFGGKDLALLATTSKDAHTYRLTVLCPSQAPVLIEVSANSETPSLIVRKIQSESKGPGTKRTYLISSKVIKLSKKQLGILLKELDSASFWTLPCADWKSPGPGGSTWKLEAVRDGKYHQITRCSPFRAVSKSCPEKKTMSQDCERACHEGDLLCVLNCLWKLSGQSCQGARQ